MNDARFRYHSILHTIDSLQKDLRRTLSTEDFVIIDNVTEKSREHLYVKESERLKIKYEELAYGHLSSRIVTKTVVKPAVLNLLSTDISPHQTNLLELGPKFVPSLRAVPHMDIITSVELAAQGLEKNGNEFKSERLRDDVANTLNKFVNKRLPSNLSYQQRTTLRELKVSDEMKVVPFDKGSGFALLTNDDML